MSDFNQPDFSQKYLIVVCNIKFYENPPSVSVVMSCSHTNGWTDVTVLIVSLCNLVNVPKQTLLQKLDLCPLGNWVWRHLFSWVWTAVLNLCTSTFYCITCRDEDGKMSRFQHTVFLENKTMDKSHNPTNPKCNILTSEPLRREYLDLLERK